MTRVTDALATRLVERLREAELDLNLVGVFTKATPSTVQEWLNKSHPPRGERLNRLQHLLATLGISSPELEYVTPYGRYLGRLLAFGVIDLEEAQSSLNTGHLQAVFRTIRGMRDPYSEDMPNQPRMSLEELQALYDDDLEAAEQELRARFAAIGQLNRAERVATTGPIAGSEETPDTRTMLIVEAATRAAGLAPLMRWLLEECSAEERHQFRTLMGGEGVFDLSNLLIQLCSERAREYQGR